MKKTILCAIAIALAGCSADLSQYAQVDANASYKTKIKACLVTQANAKLQAGTLFNDTLIATAKELSTTCLKNLALGAVGIEEESESMAQNIIQNLQNLANK